MSYVASDLMELARFSNELKSRAGQAHPHAGRPGKRGGSAPGSGPRPLSKVAQQQALDKETMSKLEHLKLAFEKEGSVVDIHTGRDYRLARSSRHLIDIHNKDLKVQSRQRDQAMEVLRQHKDYVYFNHPTSRVGVSSGAGLVAGRNSQHLSFTVMLGNKKKQTKD